MKKAMKIMMMVFTVFLAVGLVPMSAFSEEVVTDADVKAKFKKDSTGTNPMNFTYDARLYNEYQWLNTAGDGSQNITTLEFRAPLGEGKWQFRGKFRSQSLSADTNNDGSDNVDESGFGDTDLRFMTVPYMDSAGSGGRVPSPHRDGSCFGLRSMDGGSLYLSCLLQSDWQGEYFCAGISALYQPR